MERRRHVDGYASKTATKRFSLALENKGLTHTALARRLGKSPATVKHWMTKGVPPEHLARVAKELGESDQWMESGFNAPPWYIRLAIQDRNLAITAGGLSADRSYEAWIDVIRERLLAVIQFRPSRNVLPEHTKFSRSSFYRTQGIAYLESLDDNDLVNLAERLGMPSRPELHEVFAAGRTEAARDPGERRRRQQRKKDSAADEAIAQRKAPRGTSPEGIREVVFNELDVLAVRYEKMRNEKAPKIADIHSLQAEALTLLNAARPGEGLIAGSVATEVLEMVYGLAGRLGLIGSSDTRLAHAVAMETRGFFQNRTFRLNELAQHLFGHYGFTITRAKKMSRSKQEYTATVFTEEQLRTVLERAGAKRLGRLWCIGP